MSRPAPDPNSLLLLRKDDVARLLQVTGRTVDNLLRAGRLPEPIRLGAHPRWHSGQLLQWLRDQAEQAASGVAQ